jgi:predicted nucleotidyltransferase
MSVSERWKGHEPLPPDVIRKVEGLQSYWQESGDIRLVYLFGSLAERNNANDIDLAILFDGKSSYDRIALIKEDLYNLLNTQRIDLIDLNRAGPVLKFDIISKGKSLYLQDDEILNSFELRTIKEHMDTIYMRKVQRWYLKEKVSMSG